MMYRKCTSYKGKKMNGSVKNLSKSCTVEPCLSNMNMRKLKPDNLICHGFESCSYRFANTIDSGG